MADIGMGARVDNALESIRNRFSLITDGVSDLRKFDIVVELGADQKNAGNILLYVGKDGKGDIQRMEIQKFEAQRAGNTGIANKTFGAENLSFGGIADFQHAAARVGAYTIMQNVDVLAKDGIIGGFPFNPEKPEAAKVSALPEIESMLKNIRADLYNNAAPDYKFDKEGRVDGVKYKDLTGFDKKMRDVEDAISTVSIAIAMPAYSADLKKDLVENKNLFTPAQLNFLNTDLDNKATFEDKLQKAVKDPILKI